MVPEVHSTTIKSCRLQSSLEEEVSHSRSGIRGCVFMPLVPGFLLFERWFSVANLAHFSLLQLSGLGLAVHSCHQARKEGPVGRTYQPVSRASILALPLYPLVEKRRRDPTYTHWEKVVGIWQHKNISSKESLIQHHESLVTRHEQDLNIHQRWSRREWPEEKLHENDPGPQTGYERNLLKKWEKE